MVFNSILWADGEKGNLVDEDPEFFVDLNIDQIISGITAAYGDYDLRPVFDTLPESIDTVRYRQEIFRDLQYPDTLATLKDYSARMKSVTRRLSGIEKLYKYQKQGWHLDAALIYFDAIREFAGKLGSAHLDSKGLRSMRDYVQAYVNSQGFREMSEEARRTKAGISAIRYEMSIGSSRVTVRKDRGRENYNEIVREAFDKFRENKESAGNRQRLNDPSMSHVEIAVLWLIARLFPEEFNALMRFYENHTDFIDPVLARIYRELQFYISYLEYIATVRNAGLEFCIPEIGKGRDIYCMHAFDLALAHKLSSSGSPVVANDFVLSENENTIVVTGPNNGGKTTFARSFGQAFFLAALGLPIPGREARLFLVDNIYTHFEKSEDPENLRGKLEDDLVRMRKILDFATERSIIIINEMLSSTTSKDAIQIGKRIIDLIRKKNSVCVYVTFLDEFARINGVVSMVSQVDPSAPEIRTFRVSRSDPNGLAYARAIAEKYGLTYERILGRIIE
ncbi:MAG: DNA mismatch repair protein MutS [Candidatus Thermoplasmatota archaeon]|jgi:DNA mismatch repair ATPase MutS|nr:DNA mismatch repair protein MutS [Candidatus Thermoplasmatota archaeon]